MGLGHINAYVGRFLIHQLARPCRCGLAQATVRALFGVGAATLAIRRPSMTKEPSVCRTPIRPCNDCFIPEPTYKEPGHEPLRSYVRSPS